MKKFAKMISVMLAVSTLSTVFLAGCNDEKPDPDKVYTIQYVWNGTQTIQVKSGDLYSITEIPQKVGYTFTGLWDSPTDGTQYVSEDGTSLVGFSKKRNLVLYPQFTVKEYTLELDYQGAPVTSGFRSMDVTYGAQLSDLPINVHMDDKTFTGWYTKPNKEGIQVADQYGSIPSKAVVREDIFDLTDPNGYIYLYAGFKAEEYTVRLYYDNYSAPEDVKVEHGTYVKDIVTEKRVDGNAVYSWTKERGGTEVYDGKITGPMSLYAKEFAPVLDFDTDGGKAVKPIVAKAGEAISLPTPTRENYNFIEWQDENGNSYMSTTMPTESVTLKAVWQAKIVFDENGGTEVADISKAVGENITLPIPEKEGFIFAGWYTAEKEKYESKTMPATGMALKAGWYAEKNDVVVKISSTQNTNYDYPVSTPSTSHLCYEFDYDKYFGPGESYTIRIKGNVNIKHADSGYSPAVGTAYMDIYSEKIISSTYLLKSFTFEKVLSTYKSYEFEMTLTVSQDFYMCFYIDCGSWDYVYLNDFYYTVQYPDTTTLYL